MATNDFTSTVQWELDEDWALSEEHSEECEGCDDCEDHSEECEGCDDCEEPEPEVASEPEPEVASEPEPEVASEPEPEVASEPEPEVASEPEPEVASVRGLSSTGAKQSHMVREKKAHLRKYLVGKGTRY